MFNKFLIFALILRINLDEATFSSGFQTFLNNLYGQSIGQGLARTDIGENGSFGGGQSSHYLPLRRDPVVLFHGLNSYANVMINTRNFFVEKGYKNESIFATSYGPNGSAIFPVDTLLCEYVRRLILAVNKYTRRNVIVVGYSLGSTISRKAILGGKCVDTNEILGKSLTSTVSVFLSAADANQGHVRCLELSSYPMCNNVTGLFPNSSLFIQDINHKQHYEGKSTYLIASLTDDSIGFAQARLPADDINVTLSGFNHSPTHFDTLHSQFELINKRYLTNTTLQIDIEAESELTGKNCTGSIQQKPRRHLH